MATSQPESAATIAPKRRRRAWGTLLALAASGLTALVIASARPDPPRDTDAQAPPEAIDAGADAGSDGAKPEGASAGSALALSSATATSVPPASEAPDPIADAKARIASCARTYEALEDYTCLFFKRERIDGRLTAFHSMHMKVRTEPLSVYFKFVTPNAGREAIYIRGEHNGKAIVHDVGLFKLLGGTMRLDPRGSIAMEDNRHPITEAGIGHMIETIRTAWDKELTPEESRVVIHPDARVGDRDCLLIESIHTEKRPDFLFHMVKVYIDRELNLPIRFEAYDWPKSAGAEPELVEEYMYTKLNVDEGLTSNDFDPNNKSYSFGRF